MDAKRRPSPHPVARRGRAVTVRGGSLAQGGQAAAELVAIVPLILFAALALAQAVVAGWALASAGEAARVGARTAHVGGDAKAAVRHALPSLLQPAEVAADGAEVRVEVRAPALLPGVPGIPVFAAAALDPGAGSQ